MSGFITEPPLRTARRLADREVLDQATPIELAWLRRNRVWWLRALIEMEHDVNSHIEKARNDLGGAKPLPGESNAEYLKVKAAFDKINTARVHFKRTVEKRKAEVISMFGDQPPTTTGDIINALWTIDRLIQEDEVEHARSAVQYWAERLGKATT